MPIVLTSVMLLIVSNTFMTIAWYGHLKFTDKAFWIRILISWLIALPEYALQVPANAIGVKVMSPTTLKVTQEVISLCVFVVFAWWYFGEAPTWRTITAFVLIAVAVALIATGRPTADKQTQFTAAAASPLTPPGSDVCQAEVVPRPRSKSLASDV